MANKTELIPYHGWGFDRHCWDPWIERLPDQISIMPFDRGYYNGEINADFTADTRARILFAHSFGLHLCTSSQLNDADLVVIFSGFIHFHPQAAQFRRRSKLVLQKMITEFEKEPAGVLQKFLSNSYHPEPCDREIPDVFREKKLLVDLKRLNESRFNVDILKNAGKICILHGAQDTIVPKTKGRELYNRLVDRASYLEIKDGGHAIPFTHLDQCWSFVEPEISRLI